MPITLNKFPIKIVLAKLLLGTKCFPHTINVPIFLGQSENIEIYLAIEQIYLPCWDKLKKIGLLVLQYIFNIISRESLYK